MPRARTQRAATRHLSRRKQPTRRPKKSRRAPTGLNRRLRSRTPDRGCPGAGAVAAQADPSQPAALKAHRAAAAPSLKPLSRRFQTPPNRAGEKRSRREPSRRPSRRVRFIAARFSRRCFNKRDLRDAVTPQSQAGSIATSAAPEQAAQRRSLCARIAARGRRTRASRRYGSVLRQGDRGRGGGRGHAALSSVLNDATAGSHKLLQASPPKRGAVSHRRGFLSRRRFRGHGTQRIASDGGADAGQHAG